MESKKFKLTIYWIINGSTVIINTWTPWLMHLSWRIPRSQTNRLRAEDTATLSYRFAGNPNFDRRAELHFDFKKNAWYALESVSQRYHNVSSGNHFLSSNRRRSRDNQNFWDEKIPMNDAPLALVISNNSCETNCNMYKRTKQNKTDKQYCDQYENNTTIDIGKTKDRYGNNDLIALIEMHWPVIGGV